MMKPGAEKIFFVFIKFKDTRAFFEKKKKKCFFSIMINKCEESNGLTSF